MNKRLIRNGVFETNSSSSHSLSLNYGEKKRVYDTLKVNDDGVVTIDCEGYDFQRQKPRRTNDTEEKLAFFITLATRWGFYIEDLREFEELIIENTGADKVVFAGLGKSNIEFSCDFGIPSGRCLYDAIFDKNSWLFIEGDEYCLDDGVDEEEFYHPKEVTE